MIDATQRQQGWRASISSQVFILTAHCEASAMTQTLRRSAQAPNQLAPLITRQQDLRQLVNAMADAIVIVDDTGRISMINTQTENLFGYSAEELLDQSLSLLLPARFRERHQSLVARYLDHPRARPMGSGLELLGRRKDGSEIPLEISLGPLELDGRAQVVAAIRDISERREAERIQEEFIENAAHALRTPLAALRGYVDMLVIQTARGKGPPLADWQDEAVEEIGRATERLETLATALLDVTYIQAGSLEVRREPHDLVTLVRRVVARRQRTGADHPVRVRALAQPLVASIDARRIEQTILRLLANAMKYSPEGDVIEVVLRCRVVRSGGPHYEALIEVRDHGIGVPPASRQRLFSRFGGQENAAGMAGTGLSLYLCRQFIERHGGRIGVRSPQGKGTIFWFTLPLAPDEDLSRP
jgi:PAS domain S-box-containing protein